ncbi:MAG: valine--tRNA ligase [Candidatus Omnitrophica bacterium]|nr:valine--tRNA ligase [Candidatus Omnitrophota bacterium]
MIGSDPTGSDPKSFSSVYSPSEIEARLYAAWESGGFFKPDPNAPRGPFTIVIPPPNVTGILHMGHALNNTLQDVLIRFKRMQGHAALWVPGTDHAGIATQNVVERELAKEGLTRQQLGRDQFVKRVWAWKEQYGSTIVQQLRRLGASCDWSRQRFTMDEGLSRAVEACFIQLYEAGLIYRGYYLVNWCPRCQTALSDEEVIHEEVKGHLWHIRYPIQGGQTPSAFVVVATTRPETMLGDVAVAVHPEDERYRGQVGRFVQLPLCDRNIPIISDEAVDPKFGTGAVKITPAHDPVDFEIGRRHLELIPSNAPRKDWTVIPIKVMNPDGTMARANVPPAYQGLDRFECRKKVVADLDAQELLVKTEDYTHSVGHCYRCRTIIEPTLSPQWFVKMKPLAELGIEAVQKDQLRFIPERWTKVYLDWLNNIRDWCISRQIWWGHRIPIWYCSGCNRPEIQGHGRWENGRYVEPGMIVGHREEIKSGNPPPCPTCGKKVSLLQDPDVLDTWFSSWLWPFSTLGWPEGRGEASSSRSHWPEETPDLKRFYPTSVLVTGQDIIFFWVARMVMAGKFFLKRIPFKDVYIHGIIRVEGGKKMSKSLGNIIDPLEVIDRMGADALRFSIAHMASEGQDLYLSEGKFLLGRNFANKLWNAARLILGTQLVPGTAVPGTNKVDLTLPDRWILTRLQEVTRGVTESLEGYRFSEAARQLYQFLWHDFCDWYLEIAKLQREEKDGAVAQTTDWVLREALERSLRLLHPFMPFITEELWHQMRAAESPKATIMKAPWPEPESWIDSEGLVVFERLQELITEVRNIRATFGVAPKDKVSLTVRLAGVGREKEILAPYERIIQRLAGVDRLETVVAPTVNRPSASAVSHLPARPGMSAWDLMVPLGGLVDLDLERRRIEKEMEGLEARVKSKRSRLADPGFRGKAPADVVADEEESLRELEAQVAKWTESLKQMGSDPAGSDPS